MLAGFALLKTKMNKVPVNRSAQRRIAWDLPILGDEKRFAQCSRLANGRCLRHDFGRRHGTVAIHYRSEFGGITRITTANILLQDLHQSITCSIAPQGAGVICRWHYTPVGGHVKECAGLASVRHTEAG